MDESEQKQEPGAVEYFHREIVVTFSLRGRGDVEAVSRTLKISVQTMMAARLEAFERFERICQSLANVGDIEENEEYSDAPYMEVRMSYSASNDATPSLVTNIEIGCGEIVTEANWKETLGNLVRSVEPKFIESLRRQGVKIQ